MKDFETFLIIAKNVANLRLKVVATGFKKYPKAAMNRPIGSHWLLHINLCKSFSFIAWRQTEFAIEICVKFEIRMFSSTQI